MSWRQAILGDIVRIARSGISAEDIKPGTKYVGLEHINSEGDFTDVREVAVGELASTKFVFTQRHVLFGKLRPYLKKTARPDFGGICSTDILPLEPGSEIDRDFLFHVLRRQQFVDDVSSLCAGANLPRISPKVLSSLKIPLPPLDEQRRIAAILDKADALRAKRREGIAKLDQLLQSVFLDMFGDPVSNPKRWPRVHFADLLDRIESGSSPVCLNRQREDHEWGVLKLGAVTRCVFDATENKALPAGAPIDPRLEVRKGDLLFSRKNTYELVAACAYVSKTPSKLLLPDLIFRLCLKDSAPICPRYLQALLTHPRKRKQMQSLAGGSAGSMPNISKAKLNAASIELPPLPLQQQFAFIAGQIEHQKSRFQQSTGGLLALFASLQNRAFSGTL